MLTKFFSQLIDEVGEWNPQLFRELKGRLKSRNVALVGSLSILGQILLFLYFKGLLPHKEGIANPYCVGHPPADWYGYKEPSSYIPNNFCVKDLLGNIMIMEDVWWLHIFITMSIMGIFSLLVVGSYMLIADLSKEERNSTLNFIRLSPQSATKIFVGKMLGVPVLVYLFGLMAIPLHIWAGLSANIPFPLILSFYLVLAVSGIFFYSAAALFSLVSSSLGSFQAWLGSSLIFFFLLAMTGMIFEANSSFSETPFDWLVMFYPGTVLIYLVKSTFLAPNSVGMLEFNALENLRWYGQTLWQNTSIGIGFIVLNYAIWSFWIWQGLKRRFHNPLTTVISKSHSYGVSACFVILNVGFAVQDISKSRLEDNFQILQLFNLILFFILIAALTPHRQTLQDWSRYRHQNPKATRNLWADLVMGDKSPAVLAIAINIGLVTLYTIPSIFILPLNSSDRMSSLLGLIVSGMVALIYASITQLIVMSKNNKRGLIALGTIAGLTFLPLISFGFFGIQPSEMTLMWLFSALPSVATEYASSSVLLMGVLGQLAAIATLNLQMTRLLRKAGMSETKTLLSQAQTT